MLESSVIRQSRRCDAANATKQLRGRAGSRLSVQLSAIHIPRACWKIVKPDQVDLVPPAVFCRPEQILHMEKTRFSRELIGDVRQANLHDRVHDDVPFVHAITTAGFDVRLRPDANAASDASASNAFAKTLREHHG